MFDGHLTIGELAERTGCKVQTIRFYEQIGLMPEAFAPKETNGDLDRRTWSDYVRPSQPELGFPLAAVRELLGLGDDPERSCEAVGRSAASPSAGPEPYRSPGGAPGRAPAHDRQCRGGRMADCRIIEALAGHPPIQADGVSIEQEYWGCLWAREISQSEKLSRSGH